MTNIAFFDLELNTAGTQLRDIGFVLSDGSGFHKNQPNEFEKFIEPSEFICGHNIIAHDLAFLQKHFGNAAWGLDKAIDTLTLSPLLFPKQPYHHLLKDDKLQTEERNNPLNDAQKARDLFYDEVAAFQVLDDDFKAILYGLLHNQSGFDNFFRYLKYTSFTGKEQLQAHISQRFQYTICKREQPQFFYTRKPVSAGLYIGIDQL